MKKTVAVLLVALLVLGLVATSLSALSALTGAEPEFERSEPAQVDRDGTLAPFLTQEIDWAKCGDGLECGWLRVPLVHEEPDGDRIDIALVKALAGRPGTKVGTVVVNPGGPGAPGSEMAAEIEWMFDEALTDAFDVVGFDPRGTGRSAPLDCLSDAELSDFIAGDVTPVTAAEVSETARLNAEFADGCRKLSGSLVDHVSTVDVARDMEILRAALGEKTMNFYGASYGTKLGAVYADLFPERVGRFVLDAGLDPQANQVEASLVQAEGFETALRAYVADCQTEKDCPVAPSGAAQAGSKAGIDAGMAQIAALLAEIEDEPLEVGRRTLTAGEAFYGVVAPLYVDAYWPLLTDALAQAQDGRGAELLSLADSYTGRNAAGGYADNSMEAIGVINCLDDPTSITVEEIPALLPQFEEVSPTFGRVFAWGLASCGAFGFPEAEPLQVDAAGAAPIVVTGTTRDPATPMVWAEALAEQLESGVLIRRDGDGHGAYNAGNDCVDDAVEGYLLKGTVPTDGLAC